MFGIWFCFKDFVVVVLSAGLDGCRPWGDSLVLQVVLVVQEVPRSFLYILQARQEKLQQKIFKTKPNRAIRPGLASLRKFATVVCDTTERNIIWLKTLQNPWIIGSNKTHLRHILQVETLPRPPGLTWPYILWRMYHPWGSKSKCLVSQIVSESSG